MIVIVAFQWNVHLYFDLLHLNIYHKMKSMAKKKKKKKKKWPGLCNFNKLCDFVLI